jgi:hypothetical protein
MKTSQTLSEYVGREGRLILAASPGALHVPVKVLDARDRWGMVDLLVEPIGGSGVAWVAANRVNLVGE